MSTNCHNQMNEDMNLNNTAIDSVTDFFTAFVLHFYSKEYTKAHYYIRNLFVFSLHFVGNREKKIRTTKYLDGFIVMWKAIWYEIQYK